MFANLVTGGGFKDCAFMMFPEESFTKVVVVNDLDNMDDKKIPSEKIKNKNPKNDWYITYRLVWIGMRG